MSKKIATLLSLIGLVFTGLFALSTPAAAAGASSDASLSNIAIGTTSYGSGQATLSPNFSSSQTYYEAFSPIQDVNFYLTTTDPSATIKVSGGDQSNATFTSGTQQAIHFAAQANNLVTITVTAGDGVTKMTYKVNMSNTVLPQPELVSMTPTSFSTAGSTTGVAYIKHFFNGGGQGNAYCYFNIDAKYQYKWSDGQTYTEDDGIDEDNTNPDANGVVKVYIWSPDLYYAFRNDKLKSDLVLDNKCHSRDPQTGGWLWAHSGTTLPNYISYFNPSVTSADIPDTVSQMSLMKLSGPGINNDGYFNKYLLNPATGDKMWLNSKWIDSNSMYVWPEPGWLNGPVWTQPVKAKLIIEEYDDEENNDPVVVYSKDVNFTPELPTQVAVTPAKGPVTGGNVVKISGHHLCNYSLERNPVVQIGGRDVTNQTWISGCDWNSWQGSTDNKTFDGIDKFSFVVPAAVSAGNADITVDIGYGPVKIAQKYVYGDKPTVTSVTPSTVSNAGGSTITLIGTNFGSSGTPTVTIDGIKSPYVQRVSSTKVLAMVPADSNTGAVDVNIISSSGGGALDSPATLNLAASSANPTISSVAPNAGGIAGGDVITITGSGFSATATGVTIGGLPAQIDSATATTLTVETPTADTAGVVDVVVGTPTGLATKARGFTYNPTPGVTSVTPSSIKSTATGNAAKVAIAGIGFGTSGTITVGKEKAVAYTSNGTAIAGVVIPTATTGSISISILPKGAKVPFTTSVQVNGPVITYVGGNPYDASYGKGTLQGNDAYVPATSSANGGEELLIQGTNFGTSGKVKFGTKVITPTSYTDTAIVFSSPATAVGIYDITVVPSAGTVTATVPKAVNVGANTVTTTITSVQSVVNNTRSADRNTFDKVVDSSDLFTITGKGFKSTDNGAATKLYLSGADDWDAITPTAVTDTSITFHAPKTYSVLRWVSVKVVTKTDFAVVDNGIYYVGVPPQPTTLSTGAGLCTKSAIGSYTPAVIAATGPSVFGNSGTVSIDGTALNSAAVSWSDSEVDIAFADLPADLANPWGAKQITFTPSDNSLQPQTFGFDCRVVGTVTTKLNGSTSDLTISAGTAYTASAAWLTSLPNTTYVQNATGYFYQSAADYASSARNRNVQSGLPVAAGDWYIWANTGAATWDSGKYRAVNADNVVHLVITGNPVTFTPKLSSGNGTSIVYKGQLGDGTGSSSNDISYTKSTTADAVTSVTWQYRNHQCALNDPNTGWSSGLPSSVAIATSNCGGDDSTVTSWDIRVASFQMVSGGVDKSYYYLPTFNTFNLTITKKALTLSAVKAEKVYDGTTSVTLGEITVAGAVDGDNPTLDPSFAAGASFSDPNVGASKAVTLSGPFQLSAGSSVNYTLANPNMVVTGTIKKADAVVKLAASPSSVILGNTPSVAVTVTTTDARNGQAEIAAANTPDPVVVSTTPSICTISGTTVTPVKAGDCVIRATQAASTDYNAAVSYHDSAVTNEEITIKIYPTPKVISVVADDIQVATGDPINPSYSMIGLLDGDSFDNVSYAYYQGSTLLNAAPTAVGTYKIVPSGGNLTAVDSMAYNNTVKYVAGKLVITAAPPVITASSPAHGPEAGGNTLVITGTGLGTVTSITIGDVTIRKPKFVVNGTGTSISLKMPKGTGGVTVTLKAGSASVTTDYTYDAPPVVTTPLSINLKLDLKVGAKFAGQSVVVTGGGLKANSNYTLTMHSTPVVIYRNVTDSNGNFTENVVIPAKACLAAGRHDLTLVGLSPADKQVSSIGYFYLDDQCQVSGQAVLSAVTKTWTLSGFLFDYLSPNLNAGGLKSLAELAKLIKGAKTVTIYGYTETDTKSAAIKAANIILAQGRCDSVTAYLKKLGITAKFVTVAKGGVDPVSLTDQSKNRRVVIEAKY